MQRMASYDDAVAELHRAPHGEFVSERKRLAAELKAAGDKSGATQLGKLPRPPISAWTVNQLWWNARDEFDALMQSAAKLRGGDLKANTAHRDALAKLRQRAQAILTEAGHAATESTLRRVTTTLSAVAAIGGFDPDPPGALSADRDPPGFEAVGIVGPQVDRSALASRRDEPKPKAKHEKIDTKDDEEERTKREQAEAAAERRRREQAEAKRLAELRAVENAIAAAKSELERKQKELVRLQKAVEHAQGAVDKSQAALDELDAKLAEMVRETEEAG